MSYCGLRSKYEKAGGMLTQCVRCSGFVPDDCSLCPHCGATAAAPSGSAAASGASSNRRTRILRRVLRGALIAGSSMVLAACYGCPPDECGGDDLDGSGGFGGDTGGTSSGGAASGGAAPTGGGAGEGGLGGAAGFGGDVAP